MNAFRAFVAIRKPACQLRFHGCYESVSSVVQSTADHKVLNTVLPTGPEFLSQPYTNHEIVPPSGQLCKEDLYYL